MEKINKARILCIILISALVFSSFSTIIPFRQSTGSEVYAAADGINYVYTYAKDKNGKDVFMKAFSLDELRSLSHGNNMNGENSGRYNWSEIDSYPTTRYGEGKGITIPELVTEINRTSDANGVITFENQDSISTRSTDSAGTSYSVLGSYEDIYEVDRFYFPTMFLPEQDGGWSSGWATYSNGRDPDPNYELSPSALVYQTDDKNFAYENRITSQAILATDSYADRIVELTDNTAFSRNNISAITDTLVSAVNKNGGIDGGRSLRWVSPLSEKQMRTGERTASNSRYNIYDIMFSSGSTNIESKGAVGDVNISMEFAVNSVGKPVYKVYLSCETDGADIYYSTKNSHVQSKYTGTPIEFPLSSGSTSIYVKAMKEGYEDKGVQKVDLEAGPNFSIEAPEETVDGVNTVFDIYLNVPEELAVPTAQAEFELDNNSWTFVSTESKAEGFQCGTPETSKTGKTVVRFAYYNDKDNPKISEGSTKVGTLILKPKVNGTNSIKFSNTGIFDEAGQLISASSSAKNIYVGYSGTLSFNSNGGKLSGASNKSIHYGQAYGTLPNATKNGYTFMGWVDKNGKQITQNSIVNSYGDVILYAKWKANQYKITFNVNSGKSIKTKYKMVNFGNKYGSLPKASKGNKYSFIGWYTKKSGGTKVTSSTTVSSAKNITLYARYSKKYSINFNANKGKTSKKKKVVAKGIKYGSLPKASRKGYGFVGWFTKKSGGKQVTSSTIVSKNKKHTLFARYGKKYKLIFNANKGKVSKKKKTVINGAKAGSLPTPTRKGYSFKGWYTSKSGGVKITEKTVIKISKNRTVYAQWK